MYILKRKSFLYQRLKDGNNSTKVNDLKINEETRLYKEFSLASSRRYSFVNDRRYQGNSLLRLATLIQRYNLNTWKIIEAICSYIEYKYLNNCEFYQIIHS